MKILILTTTLFCLWISAYGASVMSPYVGFQSIMAFQNECIAKIQNDRETVENSVNLKNSFLTIFFRIVQKIREHGSLKNLDSIIEQTCLPAADEDRMYQVIESIITSCMDQEVSFTPDEKLIVKEKLENAYCNVYIKLATIFSFSPECISDPGTINKLQKCNEEQTINLQTPVRDWFFGNSEICTMQLKAIECLSETIKERCGSNIVAQIDSVTTSARSIIGCAVEPNSISVVNLL